MYAYSSIVLTHSQPPLSFSFHRLTLLSPVLTARTLPLKLQLTLHATASTLRTVDFHSPTFVSGTFSDCVYLCTYVGQKTSRCAQSYPGLQTQCMTWKEQLVTKRHHAPSLYVLAESASFGRFHSLG